MGGARLLFGLEEHGEGRQMARYRVWARCSRKGLLLLVASSALAAVSATTHAWPVVALAGTAAVVLGLRLLRECGSAVNVFLDAIGEREREVRARSESAGEPSETGP